MAMKLSTTMSHLKTIPNQVNITILLEFYEYLKSIDTSENYQNQNLKQLVGYAKSLGKDKTFLNVKNKDDIISFLDSKIKDRSIDPDKKWITTWNDYLWRIKYFFRWLHNSKIIKEAGDEPLLPANWLTPEFVSIKKKKTKRVSPYLESELWDRHELLTIIKYEPHKRNKAALSLLWDLDARPHEITLLKLKHVRLRERYGEGEIPHEAKTGGGPALLTVSFPYVRDWINEHPFRNEPNARLICNLLTGAPITADNLCSVMKQLKNRIIRLKELSNNEGEKEKLEFLIKTKKWNPYCIRHSAITSDSDYLSEYALKKKVRWSMNSKQGTRYIKTRMGDDLKKQILLRNGILTDGETRKELPIITCNRCNTVNSLENKYCSKCSYALSTSAFEELKSQEEVKIQRLEQRYQQELKSMRDEMKDHFAEILSMIQKNPSLVEIKPEILASKI